MDTVPCCFRCAGLQFNRQPAGSRRNLYYRKITGQEGQASA